MTVRCLDARLIKSQVITGLQVSRRSYGGNNQIHYNVVQKKNSNCLDLGHYFYGEGKGTGEMGMGMDGTMVLKANLHGDNKKLQR